MHKSRKVVWLIFLIVLLANIVIIVNYERCKATAVREIFVDDKPNLYMNGTAEYPYNTINDALRAAQDGDIIYVFGGIYNETLTIDKRVTMIGSIEEGNSIITFGSNHKYTIEITADYVNFSGFTIRDLENKVISQIGGALIHITSSNVIIQNNSIDNCTNGWGLYLESSTNNIIKGNRIETLIDGIYASSSNTNDFVENVISNCSSSGIKLQSSNHNTLYNNNLDNSDYGAYILDSEYVDVRNNTITNNHIRAIGMFRGKYNSVRYNSISDNDNQGLYVNSQNTNVFDNAFENNQVAMRIDASYCRIYNNTVSDSLSIGIDMASGTKDNILYLNRLDDNARNAYEKGNNRWYNESSMQGNYWDDYRNVDRDKDGIGDVAYTKDGVYDIYPLGIFLRPPNQPTNPSPEDGALGVGLKVTLSVKVTHPDYLLMNVYFYRVHSDQSIPVEELGHTLNVPDGSIVDCSFNLNYDTSFLWFVVVNDSKLENQSVIWYFNTKVRPGSNIPPIAIANGPVSAILDSPVAFDASGSYDPDGYIEFYRWNFGDGTSEILSVSPTHTYSSKENSGGTYDVTLTVFDNNGSSTNNVINIKIAGLDNIDPESNAGGPYSGYADAQINFVGSGSDEDGSIVSWYWTFGDGGVSTIQNPSYIYKQAGTYAAVLTVTDDRGGTSSSSTIVTVNPKTSAESPGFELLITILAIALVLIWRRKKL